MGEQRQWTFRDLASAGQLEYGDGYRTRKDQLGSSGFPILRVAEVLDGRIAPSFSEFVRPEYRPVMRGKVSRPGDIVLTTKGTVGRVAMMPEDSVEYSYSPQVCYFRVSPDALVLDKFLYYWLRSGDFKRQASGMKSQTDMADYLNLTDIGSLRIAPPPRSDQRAAVQVLGALDDKIMLNERMAETARMLCQALMAELWGRGGVSSLVRGDFVLQGDWRRTTLGALCESGAGSIQTGPFGSQLHSSDYVESGIPSVMPQNIGDNVISEEGIARISDADAQRLSKYLLVKGDIVYSRRGDVKRRALVRDYEEGWLCGTGCLRVRVGTSTSPSFMSYYLGEPEVQGWIEQHAVGATMPNLNTSILGELPVVLPPEDEVARVDERLSGLDAVAANVQHENRTLAELRDTLLPQLLSGKIRVKDAVRTVEEAV